MLFFFSHGLLKDKKHFHLALWAKNLHHDENDYQNIF